MLLGVLSVGNKYVADTPYRLQVARMRWVVFKQAAQAVNLHVDGTIEGFAFFSARQFQQSLAFHRPIGVAHQGIEQRVFTAGKRNHFIVA